MTTAQTNTSNKTIRKPETREQTLKKIEFYLPTLTDLELRLAAAFIRGLTKKS